MTGYRVLVGNPAMRLHKRWYVTALVFLLYPCAGSPGELATLVMIESVSFASGLLEVFGSGETPVGDRPLGSRHRQAGEQTQALQRSVLLGMA